LEIASIKPPIGDAKTLKRVAAKARTALSLNNQYHFFDAGNNRESRNRPSFNVIF
jgi:hypothetical protein